MNEKEILATSTIKLDDDKFLTVELIRVNRKSLSVKDLNVEESISENPSINTVKKIMKAIKNDNNGNTCIYYNITASFKYKETVVVCYTTQQAHIIQAFNKYLELLKIYSTELFSDDDYSIYFCGEDYRKDIEEEDDKLNYSVVKAELNKIPLDIRKRCKEECIRAIQKWKDSRKNGSCVSRCGSFCKLADLKYSDTLFDNYLDYCLCGQILDGETPYEWQTEL